jgi:ATP-dependent exoDNAse (exonuclease V) beta subunit
MALRIYNASAGSGKTFTLVSEFLRLSLCSEPFIKSSYQGILAITFTKKAASEMKHRTISALHDIASGRMEGQGNRILAEKKLTEIELKNRARWVLEDVLFNYGKLNVSTIDSFFQKMLISFSKETCFYDPFGQHFLLESCCTR